MIFSFSYMVVEIISRNLSHLLCVLWCPSHDSASLYVDNSHENSNSAPGLIIRDSDKS